MRGRRRAFAAAAVLLAVPAATPAQAARPPAPATHLQGATVLAAASLTDAFRAMAPNTRFSFAGSDQLAFQIEQGAPADVFASASTSHPDELFRQGLVLRPGVFALNRLVVIVPRANPAGIRRLADLARPGVKLVVGDEDVPVGAYARTALRRLGLSGPVLANVVSNETDARAVVAKVALGEADAGIVYRTDVRAVRARVRTVALPSRAQPVVAYSIAVVRSARNPAAAAAFVRFVRSAPGREWLRRFGFTAPP